MEYAVQYNFNFAYSSLEGKRVRVGGEVGGGGGGAKSFMKGTGRKKDLTAGRVSDIISVQLELPAYTPIFAYQSLIA